MHNKNMPKQRGFTLIELLVVVMAIAILTGIVFDQIKTAINEGKNMKRKADIALLADAVNSYASEHYSSKPDSSNIACTLDASCASTITESLRVYLVTLPSDPDSSKHYTYQSDGNECKFSATLSNGKAYQYACLSDQFSIINP